MKALKEAVPPSAPEGVPRNATQFTITDPFVPSPDSNTHTRKPFCVTSVVYTTAESCTLSVSFSWLMDARTRTFPELENTWGYRTFVQWSESEAGVTVKFIFPCWTWLCPETKIIKENIRGKHFTTFKTWSRRPWYCILWLLFSEIKTQRLNHLFHFGGSAGQCGSKVWARGSGNPKIWPYSNESYWALFSYVAICLSLFYHKVRTRVALVK